MLEKVFLIFGLLITQCHRTDADATPVLQVSSYMNMNFFTKTFSKAMNTIANLFKPGHSSKAAETTTVENVDMEKFKIWQAGMEHSGEDRAVLARVSTVIRSYATPAYNMHDLRRDKVIPDDYHDVNPAPCRCSKCGAEQQRKQTATEQKIYEKIREAKQSARRKTSKKKKKAKNYIEVQVEDGYDERPKRKKSRERSRPYHMYDPRRARKIQRVGFGPIIDPLDEGQSLFF